MIAYRRIQENGKWKADDALLEPQTALAALGHARTLGDSYRKVQCAKVENGTRYTNSDEARVKVQFKSLPLHHDPQIRLTDQWRSLPTAICSAPRASLSKVPYTPPFLQNPQIPKLPAPTPLAPTPLPKTLTDFSPELSSGDARLLAGARSRARASYENHRQLSPSSEEAATAVKHAHDVAKLLKENVVQGVRAEGGEEKERYREFCCWAPGEWGGGS